MVFIIFKSYNFIQIFLFSSPQDVPEEVVIKPTLKDAMSHISTLSNVENVYICGGYGVYDVRVYVLLSTVYILNNVWEVAKAGLSSGREN